MSAEAEATFCEWAIVELMGHRKLAGRLSQAPWPPGWLRLDIPGPDGDMATQFYSPTAGYSITPTTEDIARRFAEVNRPVPVTRYELPSPPADEGLYERCDPGDGEPDDDDEAEAEAGDRSDDLGPF